MVHISVELVNVNANDIVLHTVTDKFSWYTLYRRQRSHQKNFCSRTVLGRSRGNASGGLTEHCRWLK